ncbi:28930_t:CDS:2, partial [Gigaspora margarita]
MAQLFCGNICNNDDVNSICKTCGNETNSNVDNNSACNSNKANDACGDNSGDIASGNGNVADSGGNIAGNSGGNIAGSGGSNVASDGDSNIAGGGSGNIVGADDNDLRNILANSNLLPPFSGAISKSINNKYGIIKGHKKIIEFKSNFKFHMFDVNKKLNENDYTDPDMKYDDNLSSRKLSWSIAASDELFGLKSYKATIRLLAISCINSHDMTLKKFIEGPKYLDLQSLTLLQGSFEKEVLLKFEHSGVVKLFSKNEDNEKTDMNDQNMDIKKKTNEDQNTDTKKNTDNQNMDKYLLIVLNVSGIYKYHFVHLNRRSIGEIQKLKYPKRIYSAMINSKLDNPMSHERRLVLANLNLKYILKCLNKHYFFVDTIRGVRDTWNLQFKNKLIMCFEIDSIGLETGVTSSIESSMYFFNGDEKLLTYNLKINGQIGIFSAQYKN